MPTFSVALAACQPVALCIHQQSVTRKGGGAGQWQEPLSLKLVIAKLWQCVSLPSFPITLL